MHPETRREPKKHRRFLTGPSPIDWRASSAARRTAAPALTAPIGTRTTGRAKSCDRGTSVESFLRAFSSLNPVFPRYSSALNVPIGTVGAWDLAVGGASNEVSAMHW